MRSGAQPTSRKRLRACLALATVAMFASVALHAERMILPVRQGTGISVTPDRDGRLVVHLGGRLWRLEAAGGAASPITPAEQFSSRPAFSPDGQSLAFQSLRDGYFQVVVADADGGDPRQVTSGPWHHLAPAWAPDGLRLAIASDRAGDFSIWELDVDSQALTQLTFEAGPELDPAWDPASRSLAYVHQHGDVSSLMVRSPGGATRALVSSPGRLRAPAWRPDGTVIALVADTAQGPRLHMVILSDPPVMKVMSPRESAIAAPAAWRDRNHLLYTADGGIRQREFGAMVAREIPLQAELAIERPAAPPSRSLPPLDGKHAVQGFGGLSVLPDGHIVTSALGDLWELDRDGQLLRAITQDDFVDRDPAVSADGRYLAFVSDRDGSEQIWRLDLALGEAHRLTTGPGVASRPAWDSGARRLAYLARASPQDQRSSLRVLDVHSGEITELTDRLRDSVTPAWTPDDEGVAITQQEAGMPRLLVFAADGSGAPRSVTLPSGVAGPDATGIQWSRDGRSLLTASAAGLHFLPVQDNGLVGADARLIANVPAQAAQIVPGEEALLFIDAAGLGRAREGQAPERIPVALSWQPPALATRTVIRASRVFDATSDGYLYNHEVIVEANRIVAVQPWSATPPVPGETVIDARGKAIVPGLIDLSMRLPEASGERLGRTLFAYGITTVQVFDPAGSRSREVAERWRAHNSGPRLLQAREWCATAPANDHASPVIAGGAVHLCPTATGRAVTLAETARADGAPVWSGDWLAAASGLVEAVAPRASSMLSPAEESISGDGLFFQDAIDVIVHSGAVLIPTLAPYAMPLVAAEQPDLLASRQYRELLRPEERDALARAWNAAAGRGMAGHRAWLRDQQRQLTRIAAGGGHVATASGAPAAPYGLGLHVEMRLLAGAGIRAAQVLRMATAEAARALGLQEEIGILQPGRRADLLIVDGDPLRALEDLLKVHAVMADGRLRDNGSLYLQPALEKFTPRVNLGSAAGSDGQR